MKKFLLPTLLCFFAAPVLQAQTSTLAAVEENGTRGTRLNLVFLSEGYTSTQMGTFADDVDDAVEFLFTREPWSRFRSYCNIYRIQIASNQSGTDNGQAGGTRDTYFQTGFNSAELTPIAEIAERHDLVICSDEIHCGLVLDERAHHVPMASLDQGIADRCVTLMAPSKTWNIPGLGCSFAVVSNARLRRRLLEVMRGIVPHVNGLGFAATEAAYRDGSAWREALLAYLRSNARCVLGAIARMPGLSSWPVEATYLAWIDARGLGIDNPARFFEQAGVGLSDEPLTTGASPAMSGTNKPTRI